jgi:hypothetical protein
MEPGMLRLVIAFLGLAAMISQACAHERPKRLPLGDNRLSTEARRGYLFACEGGPSRRGGAHVTGPWIRDGHWHPDEKPTVEGAVTWGGVKAAWTIEDGRRVLAADGLPPHVTGEFPIRPGSRAHEFDRNPNSIRQRRVMASLVAQPVKLDKPACVGLGPIGFTLDGVAFFNALDLMKWDAPAYEVQDVCNGHPEERGVYHYHDWSPCIRNARGERARPGDHVGWMIDGHPIIAPGAPGGGALTNADLDECHGKIGKVLIDGVEVTTYHYQFTWEFPYTIGCFRAEPAARRR